MENNEKLIKDQFDSLPDKLKKALSTIAWQKKIADIAKERGLDEAASSALETETMLILYGFIPPDTYADNLEQNLGISNELSELINEDVNNKIFTELEKEVGKLESNNTIHDTLPVIEEGERVHDVPHDAKLDAVPKPVAPVSTPAPAAPTTPTPQTPEVSIPKLPTNEKLRPHSDTPIKKDALKTPDYRYPGGADPYREPLA